MDDYIISLIINKNQKAVEDIVKKDKNKYQGEVLDYVIESKNESLLYLFIDYSNQREYILKLYKNAELYKKIIDILIDKLYNHDLDLKDIIKTAFNEKEIFEYIVRYENIPEKMKNHDIFKGKNIEKYIQKSHEIQEPNKNNILISSFHGSFNTGIYELPPNIFLIQPKCCGMYSWINRYSTNTIIRNIIDGIKNNKQIIDLYNLPFIIFKPGSKYCDITLALTQVDHIKPSLYSTKNYEIYLNKEKQEIFLNNFIKIINLILLDYPGKNLNSLPYEENKVAEKIPNLNTATIMINFTTDDINKNLVLTRYLKDYLYLLTDTNHKYLNEIYDNYYTETSLKKIIDEIYRKEKNKTIYLISNSCQSLNDSEEICNLTKCVSLYQKDKNILENLYETELNISNKLGYNPLKNFYLYKNNLKNLDFLQLYKNKTLKYSGSIFDWPDGHFLLSLLNDEYKFYVEQNSKSCLLDLCDTFDNFIAYLIVLIVFYNEEITIDNFKFLENTPFTEEIGKLYQNYINICTMTYFDKDKLNESRYEGKLTDITTSSSKIKKNMFSDAYSPILYAIKNDNYEMIKILNELGWDENRIKEDYKKNLFVNFDEIIIEINDLNILNYIKNILPIPLNSKNKNGKTFLYRAVNEGNIELVNYLLSNDVDININAPLHLAIEKGNIEILNLLLSKGADINIQDIKDNTPLHIAVITGNIEILNILLSHGADVNIPNINNVTPLYLAVIRNNIEMVKLLLTNAKIDVNISYPLYIAIENNNIEIVRLLLSHGANVNIMEIDDITALYLTVEKDNIEIFNEDIDSILLSKGIYVNTPLNINITPLYLAVKKDNIEIIKLLLSHGANVNIDSPLNLAIIQNNIEIVKLLLLNGANYNYIALQEAIYQDNIEIFKLLLSQYDDEYLLHFAINEGSNEIIKILLANGDIDVNIPGDNDKTPLYLAVQKGNIEIIKLLLANDKIDVNIPNIYGKTPLHLAVQKGNIEIIKLLLTNAKIDVNKSLDEAKILGNKEIIQLLINKGEKNTKQVGGNYYKKYLKYKKKYLELTLNKAN
jgi:ankyrin repeat protein